MDNSAFIIILDHDKVGDKFSLGIYVDRNGEVEKLGKILASIDLDKENSSSAATKISSKLIVEDYRLMIYDYHLYGSTFLYEIHINERVQDRIMPPQVRISRSEFLFDGFLFDIGKY